jgi:hypothetical protein
MIRTIQPGVPGIDLLSPDGPTGERPTMSTPCAKLMRLMMPYTMA